MRVCPECGLETEEKRCPKDGRVTIDRQVLDYEDPNEGRCIGGRYTLEDRVGRGGYGAVYRARHGETGGQVAVKILRADAAERESSVKRFHLEAQNAAALRHPNTVRVIDFGAEEETLFLVMEFLRGRSLNAVLAEDGRLPWRRAVHVTRQILAALWAAHEHERRIIHRDVKPHNIMLSDEPGQPDFVKVLDFGLARSLDSSGAGTKGALGTPRYMAPEQWRSEKVSPATDLYATGCVLYEMIAGRPPFVPKDDQGPQAIPLSWMHLNVAPRSVQELAGADVPSGLCRLVHLLLQKEAGDRPQTAREVLDLLDRVEQGDGLGDIPMRSAVGPGVTASGEALAAGAGASDSGTLLPASLRSRPFAFLAGLSGIVAGAAAVVHFSGVLAGGAEQGVEAPPRPPAVVQPVSGSPAARPAPAAASGPAPDAEPGLPPEPKGPEPVHLVLASEPAGARVMRGDELLCTTPCDEELAATGGVELLRVRAAGHRDARVEVSLEPGSRVERTVKLARTRRRVHKQREKAPPKPAPSSEDLPPRRLGPKE